MKIEVHWQYADDESDEILLRRKVLYAYTDGLGEEIVYIGKADASSVKERLNGKHKSTIFKHMETNLKFKKYGISVGTFELPAGKRLSSELISDVESLLIYSLKPVENIQSISGGISRPGMEVFCDGDWPCDYNHFIDE